MNSTLLQNTEAKTAPIDFLILPHFLFCSIFFEKKYLSPSGQVNVTVLSFSWNSQSISQIFIEGNQNNQGPLCILREIYS